MEESNAQPEGHSRTGEGWRLKKKHRKRWREMGKREKWDWHLAMMESVQYCISLFNKLPSVVELWRRQRREGGENESRWPSVCMSPTHNSLKSISPPTLLPSVLFTHCTARLIMIKERLTAGSWQSYIICWRRSLTHAKVFCFCAKGINEHLLCILGWKLILQFGQQKLSLELMLTY